MGRRSRFIGFLAALALLFAAALVAGFALATRWAPERARAGLEQRLAEAVRGPVALGELRLGLRGGLELVARDARLGPGPGVGTLRVGRLVGRVDPFALARGRLSLNRLVLEDVEWLLPAAGGPAAGAAPPRGAREEDLADVPRKIVLRGARVGRAGAVPDAAPLWLLEQLDAELQRGLLRPHQRLELSARLPGGGGGLRLEGVAANGELRGEITLEATDVSALGRALAAAGLALPGELLPAVGRIDGRVGLRRAGGETALDATLAGRGLRWRATGAGEPTALARLDARGQLSWDAGGLHLREGRLDDGRVSLALEGERLGPADRPEALRLSARVRDAQVGDLLAALRVVPVLRPGLEAVSATLEAGRVEELRLDGRAPPADWQAILAGGPMRRPGALRLHLRVSEARLRVGAADHLEAVSGAVDYTGDVLRVRDLRARFHQRTLPVLDAQLRGLAQLRGADELHCIPPPAVAPLPGVRPLAEWVRSRRDDPQARTWQRIAVEADWISHPTLLCSLEQVTAELRPLEGGLEAVVEHGVWAGLPVSGAATWREARAGDEERVAVQATLGPPFEAMAPTPLADPWARGRFRAEATRLGDWAIRGAEGRFEARGDRLELQPTTIDLDPAGPVVAWAAVDLGRNGPPAFRAGFELGGVPLEGLAAAGGHPELGLRGRLHGAGAVEGVLRPGLPLLSEAEGMLSLHAREGEIHRRLPVLLAVAAADGRTHPFGDRDTLSYSAIDLAARVHGGALDSEVFTLEGPSVRMLASGTLAVTAPHGLEGVLGLFFFPGLDAVIDRLPLIDRMLLGPNGNLVGAYYAVTGPWDAPDARLIPIKSLASGPASFVLEGLPGFVWGGLKRIQAVLGPRVADGTRPQADS